MTKAFLHPEENFASEDTTVSKATLLCLSRPKRLLTQMAGSTVEILALSTVRDALRL